MIFEEVSMGLTALALLLFAAPQDDAAVKEYLRKAADQIREKASSAAALDPADWKAIMEGADYSPWGLENQSATALILGLPSNNRDVAFDDEHGLSPDLLRKAVEGNKYTLLNNVKVESLSVDSEGGAAGTLQFETPKFCRGRMCYKAKLDKGQWTITGFSFPTLKGSTSRQTDGKWKMAGRPEFPGKEVEEDGYYFCSECLRVVRAESSRVNVVRLKKGEKLPKCADHPDAWWMPR